MKINYQLKQPDFARTMKRLSADFHKELQGEVVAATRELSLQAKRNTPVDKGGIRRSIKVENKGLTGIVTVGAEYAAYQEFGTGTNAVIPNELRDIASQFKGRGFEGKIPVYITGGRKANWGWKMIQFPINLRPQPFFYPAFFTQSEKFVKALDRLFDKVKSKHWR